MSGRQATSLSDKRFPLSNRWHLPILLLSSLLIRRTQASNFIVTVPAKDEECFILWVPPGSTITGNYNILEDHLKADQVYLSLLDEGGRAIYRSKYNQDHGSFEVKKVKGKRFQFCVSNNILNRPRFDNKPRSVGVQVRIQPPVKEVLDEKTRSLVEYSEKVFNAVNDLAGHFSFRKIRESQHRQIVELIFSEILLWTLAQAFFVVVLAVGGVLYLQRAISKTVV
jgi:emp24/gp25L/p24 family/GOLD